MCWARYSARSRHFVWEPRRSAADGKAKFCSERSMMMPGPVARQMAWLALLVVLSALPGPAAAQDDSVDVIVSGGDTTPQNGLSVRDFFNLIKRTAASLTGYAQPLTKSEKWSLPKDQLEAVQQAAAKRGLLVREVGPEWNRLWQAAAPGLSLTPKQKSLIDLAAAGKATAGVKLTAGPTPSMLEYALSKDAKAGGSSEPPKLTVALGDQK